MIDPAKLTKEESDYIICHIFGTKTIKEYFRRSDRAFRQICKGFRPQSLSDEKICQLVYKNIKTDFISSFMVNNIKQMLEVIEKNLTEIQKEMQNEPEQLSLLPELEEKKLIFTKEDALILFLSHSDFSEMPELYFRLTEQPVTEEYLALLKAAIRTAKSKDNQETDNKLAETTEQIETLQKEIEALETMTEQQQKNYQEITIQLEQTKTELLTA